jgi:hypothetical protein
MSLRNYSFGVIVLAIAVLTALPVLAQPPGMRPQEIKTAGTVVALNQNQLQLTTNTNQTIYVMFGPNTQVSVSGKAEESFLKSKVNVEFVADIEKGGAVKEKIFKMLIVSPTADRPLGLFAPEFATPTKGKKGDKDDNAKPAAHDPGFGDTMPAKKGKKKSDDSFGDSSTSKSAKPGSIPGTFTVRGTIKTYKNNQISVSTGHPPTIKAEVANDVTIDVEMADLSAVQRDDQVKVTGLTTQARPNIVMAKSITVELANPLSGAKKHTTKPAKTPAKPAKAKKETSEGDDLLGTGK